MLQILCNGPGTCIPLCVIAFIFKVQYCIELCILLHSSQFQDHMVLEDNSGLNLNMQVLGIRWSSIFYVESIARVKRLSLSGLILYKLYMADQFFVQWPQLQRLYPRARYVGCLM